MKSKTIIISSPEENNTRGILTLFQEDDLLKCRLRTYNLQAISKSCKLGIFHENEVFSANLIYRTGVYESSFAGVFDIDKDFYIALIDTAKNNQVLLAGGTYQGYYFNDNSVFLKSEDFSQLPTQNINNFQEKNTQQDKFLGTQVLNESDDCEEDCDKCSKCKYKEFFYSHNVEQSEFNIIDNQKKCLKESSSDTKNQLEINNDNVKNEQEEQKQKVEQLIKSIVPQFDSLFENYKQDEELNSLIDNSKFVKICENGEQFSIGAIYEEKEIKFICYAVKRDCNLNPPKELGEHYQWLPLDVEDPLSVGYYVVFQDASDLKIVEF